MGGDGGAYRGVLAIRDARALITASAASQLGDWLYNAALLGYVYAATGSAAWVGAATIFRLLPFVLLGPLGGTVADRYERRTVLLAGDLARGVLMGGLAVVVAADGPVAVVIGLTALASAAGTAERPAAMALLPRLVGESRLGPANALLHTVQDLGVVVGPAIGAILLAVAPHWVAFAVNGLTFTASALMIATIRKRVAPARKTGRVRAELMYGLRTVRRTPFVLPLLLVVVMAELTYGAQTVQLVLYAEQRLGLDNGGYGWLLAALGLGGLVSTLVNARLSTSARISSVAAVCGGLYCATQLAYAGLTMVALAIVVTVIGGAGFVACEVVVETALARIAPRDSIGRVMGVFDSISVAAMVAGAALAAILVQTTTLLTSLVILGGLTLGFSVLARIGLRGLDATNREREDALAARIAVLEHLPITAGVPRFVLEQLASSAQYCELPSGVDVVALGAPAHAFYAVVDGGVVVHRNEEIAARLGPGDYFGERGLLDNAPRNATVTTLVPTTVLRVDGDELLEALQASPTLRPTLDRSNVTATHGSEPTPATPALVDDPKWAGRVRGSDTMTVEGKTVLVVSAGYGGKVRAYRRMNELGAKLVFVDEPGHWSESFVADGLAHAWLPVPIVGEPDRDAAAIVEALEAAEIRPDAVLTFWEDSVCVAARVARALGLPGNPPEAVDACRSKLRTRELCAQLGLPSPRAKRVRSLDELFAAAGELGFPAVVKPEFGASATGVVKVEHLDSLPTIYTLVRDAVSPDKDVIFRAGNDLLLEDYLDGVEFDVDLVMHEGQCAFVSVSQNWPTREPSFQETGLHCPPDHSRREVARLTDFVVRVVQAFGLTRGVLHVEAKCTSKGPRIVEINARMGGARIHEIVEQVWGVDLIEQHLREALDLPLDLKPSRKPQCAVVNSIVHADRSGRLEALPITTTPPPGCRSLAVDDVEEIGTEVVGPEGIFATVLAEITLAAKDLRSARELTAQVLREPPVIAPTAT